MKDTEIRRSLNKIIYAGKILNKIFKRKSPWKLNPSSEEYRRTIYNALEMSRIIAIMMYPFTPRFSVKIMECL